MKKNSGLFVVPEAHVGRSGIPKTAELIGL